MTLRCIPYSEPDTIEVLVGDRHVTTLPRPSEYQTPEECLHWVRIAYGCERCSGGGNTRSQEHLSDPDRSITVAEECHVCHGLGVNI